MSRVVAAVGAFVALLGAATAAERLLAAESSDLDLSETVTLSSGYMMFDLRGVIPSEGTNATNLALEWSHFAKKDLAIFSSYRVAQDVETERTRYQAGTAGVRYFPMTLGMPIGSFRNLSVVRYDFGLKPHVDLGLVVGRYLLDSVYTENAADYSSEFWGINVGGGVLYGVAERYALDLKASYEYDIGYGPLQFSASTIFVLLGMVYYI